jgi:nucleotide-binding universal stress UspA family protein
MLPIKTILCPVDFSDNSKPVFQLACALARDYAAHLHLVHVVAPPVVYGEGMVSITSEKSREELICKLKDLQASEPQVDIDHHLREGEPFLEILDMAKRLKSDLIVMGTHGWTGLTRLLMGSVAEQLMRKASCPVLTINGKVSSHSVGHKAEKKTGDRALQSAT